MTPNVLDVFGADGLLAARFDGYAPRSGQIAMARAVDLALDDGAHLLVEGPTGTGKSLAYLVPSVLHAVRTGRRVLVVTANIALQEQLVSKDLPLLAEVLPVPFDYALLKGRSNYLCLDRLPAGTRASVADELEAQRDQVVAWASNTAKGDVSELPFEPDYAVWQHFSVRSEDCPGKDCALHAQCHAQRARARAAEAQAVVTNYHLLFAHLAVREATGEDLVLPSFDVAILDEAHKAADIARDFFGWRVSFHALRRLARPLRDLGHGSLAATLEALAGDFAEHLRGVRDARNYRVRLRRPGQIDVAPLLEALPVAASAYRAATPSSPKEANRVARLAELCDLAVLRLEAAVGLTDDNAVVFIDLDARGRGVLCAKPIDVGPTVQRGLFDLTSSVVLASATLSTGGSFELVRSELGVPDARELVVESPFDFEDQALLVIPDGLPDPTDASWPGTVGRVVREVVERAQGRTLGLFTSYRNLDLAHRQLRGVTYPVWRQGEQPRTALVEAFRSDVRSVLLGTESFWTGVDVPGEALSAVVIDRLPFPSPDDAVLDAIKERDPRWFLHYGLPRAVLAFKQGFGRLIRRAGDFGVVVVLDRRLVTRPYGHLFLRSLPRVRVSRRIEDVSVFLGTDSPAAKGA